MPLPIAASKKALHNPHVWISESLLRETFDRFANTVRIPRGKRHGCNVPGPLEASRRLAKRRLNCVSNDAGGPLPAQSYPVWGFGWMGGWERPQVPEWKWLPPGAKEEEPVAKKFSSPLPSWLDVKPPTLRPPKPVELNLSTDVTRPEPTYLTVEEYKARLGTVTDLADLRKLHYEIRNATLESEICSYLAFEHILMLYQTTCPTRDARDELEILRRPVFEFVRDSDLNQAQGAVLERFTGFLALEEVSTKECEVFVEMLESQLRTLYTGETERLVRVVRDVLAIIAKTYHVESAIRIYKRLWHLLPESSLYTEKGTVVRLFLDRISQLPAQAPSVATLENILRWDARIFGARSLQTKKASRDWRDTRVRCARYLLVYYNETSATPGVDIGRFLGGLQKQHYVRGWVILTIEAISKSIVTCDNDDDKANELRSLNTWLVAARNSKYRWEKHFTGSTWKKIFDAVSVAVQPVDILPILRKVQIAELPWILLRHWIRTDFNTDIGEKSRSSNLLESQGKVATPLKCGNGTAIVTGEQNPSLEGKQTLIGLPIHMAEKSMNRSNPKSSEDRYWSKSRAMVTAATEASIQSRKLTSTVLSGAQRSTTTCLTKQRSSAASEFGERPTMSLAQLGPEALVPSDVAARDPLVAVCSSLKVPAMAPVDDAVMKSIHSDTLAFLTTPFRRRRCIHPTAIPFIGMIRAIKRQSLSVEPALEYFLSLALHLKRWRMFDGIARCVKRELSLQFTIRHRQLLAKFVERHATNRPEVALRVFNLDRRLHLSQCPTLLLSLIRHSTIDPARILVLLWHIDSSCYIPPGPLRTYHPDCSISPERIHLVHEAALAFAMGERYSARNAWTCVMRCWQWLRDHLAPVGPLMARAMVIAGCVRIMKPFVNNIVVRSGKGRRPGKWIRTVATGKEAQASVDTAKGTRSCVAGKIPKGKLDLVLKVVGMVEGEEARDQVDRMAYEYELKRREHWMAAKRGGNCVKGELLKQRRTPRLSRRREQLLSAAKTRRKKSTYQQSYHSD